MKPTRRSRTRLLHRSRRPWKRARDQAILAFYGLTFTEKEGRPSRLEKAREQRELFEEFPLV